MDIPNSEAKKAVETINDYRYIYDYTIFSYKITGDLAIDFQVIEGVMQNAKPHERYIFDANMGLNIVDALRCAAFLS